METINFEKLKVGDKVFSTRQGWGEITSTGHTINYPILVKFEKHSHSFTKDGKYESDNIYPELYLSNPFEQFQERVMEVSENRDVWSKRVVFMEKNGKYLAWDKAKTLETSKNSTDVSAWTYAREIEKQKVTLELTYEQIESLKKQGIL